MKVKKFSCPKCGTGIPKRTALFMTKFTRIRCKQCGIVLRPKKKTISTIGGIVGGVGGGLSSLIVMYAVNRWNWLVAGTLLLAFLVLVTLVSFYLTIKLTKFIKN